MIEIFALLVVAPISALLWVYSAEVLAGLRPAPPPASPDAQPSITVLVPAHNEASGIAVTLAALALESVNVLVVADNCTDNTAAAARAAGVSVIERHDAVRRGKGFALAFGRDALMADPPTCVVVLDADCVMEPGDVVRLAQRSVATGKPVQSCYLLSPDRAAPVTVQISSFAFLVKNLVRQRGAARLGRVAVLNGTGMAFPWPAFRDAPLATDDIVEDLALGIWLTRNGQTPCFFEGAVTLSKPAKARDMLAQRTRWERGFVATARRRALPLLASGLRDRSRAQIWLGLHLLVPPLAMLFVVSGVVAVAAALVGLTGQGWWPLGTIVTAVTAAGIATCSAWYFTGRGTIGARDLLRVPQYVFGKLPIYFGLVRRSRPGWVRTRRAGEGDTSDH